MIDFLSLGVIFVILAVSGGIAFVADGLGKKIGKKRVSIRVRGWSMRPKYVASLGTVAMGVFVSALTIGFVMAVSTDARAWLLRGRQILADNQKLAEENTALQTTNRGFKAESDHLRSQNEGVKDTNRKLADANRRLDLSLRGERKDLVDLQAQRETLLAERTHLGGQVKLLKEGLRGTRVALGASRASLDKVRVSLAFYREAVRRAQSAVGIAQAKLDVTTHNLNVALANNKQAFIKNQEIFQQNLTIARQNVELEAAVKKGEDHVADLTRQQDAAEKAYGDAKARLADAQGLLRDVQFQVDQLQEMAREQASFLKGGFETSRKQAMIYRRGEEVARVVVPAGATAATARDALATLLQTARAEAAGRGAKGRSALGGSFEAADIVDRQDPKTKETISAADLKREIVSGLVGKREDQVVVAVSSLNAFATEVVSLDIAALPNPMVYRRNETVAETQIDGGQAEGRILAAFSEFYNGQVRKQAVQDHMIPRAGAAAPFGGIPDADVFNLVQTVKRAGRAVRVQAIAGEDIRAADLLRLEFRVR